jgi:hypothetical protein
VSPRAKSSGSARTSDETACVRGSKMRVGCRGTRLGHKSKQAGSKTWEEAWEWHQRIIIVTRWVPAVCKSEGSVPIETAGVVPWFRAGRVTVSPPTTTATQRPHRRAQSNCSQDPSCRSTRACRPWRGSEYGRGHRLMRAMAECRREDWPSPAHQSSGPLRIAPPSTTSANPWVASGPYHCCTPRRL